MQVVSASKENVVVSPKVSQIFHRQHVGFRSKNGPEA